MADNGSTDGSAEIAERMGASIVKVPDKGYGNALRSGIEAAQVQIHFHGFSPYLQKGNFAWDIYYLTLWDFLLGRNKKNRYLGFSGSTRCPG